MFDFLQIGIMKLITSADFEIFEIRFKCILFALLIILYVFQLIHLTRYGLLSKNILYDLLILMFTIATLVQYYKYGNCLSKTLKYYQSSKQTDSNNQIQFKQFVSFSHCLTLNRTYHICLAVLTLLLVFRFVKLLHFPQVKSLLSLKFKLFLILVLTLVFMIITLFVILPLRFHFYAFFPTVVLLFVKLILVCLIVVNVALNKL